MEIVFGDMAVRRDRNEDSRPGAGRRRTDVAGCCHHGPMIERAIPVLKVADAAASTAGYGRLGFTRLWEHRFEPGVSAFVEMARGQVRLFPSEHEGDAPRGGLVYLRLADVDAIAARFGTPARDTEWGTRECELPDPDDNRLRVGAVR